MDKKIISIKNILPILLGLTVCLLIGCQSNDKLEIGRWIGSLSPMNHPEMENPLTYDVSYADDALMIDIVGPGDTVINAQNPWMHNDTLYFSFPKPEEQVLLDWKLANIGDEEFAGRCADKSGKWAYFTMRYPKAVS